MAHQLNAIDMQTGSEKAKIREKKGRCRICDVRLSMYNLNDVCHAHQQAVRDEKYRGQVRAIHLKARQQRKGYNVGS